MEAAKEITEVAVETKKEDIFYQTVKRIFDILVSLGALTLLSPVMLIIAIIIKLEDRGPVFYASKRIGTGRKEFKLYKFRSMYVDADKHLDELKKKTGTENDIRFKLDDDPRVTKVGKFIRKFSLDELPQLWNVFIGDISIIGPRPHSTYEVEQYSEYAMQRFNVKAGLMCYSEVMGRSDLPFDESIDLDIRYVKERSLLTDIKIMFMAVGAILKGKGAH